MVAMRRILAFIVPSRCFLLSHRIARNPTRGGYFSGSGLNASFRFGCPRFSKTRPLLVLCLLINEPLKNSRAEAGGKLDGGVLPLLMSIGRIGSTKTRRWR